MEHNDEDRTPATPFWEGYKRPPRMTADLTSTLAQVMYAHPEQRLGQMLVNLTNGIDLFNIYDEALLALLRDTLHPTMGADDFVEALGGRPGGTVHAFMAGTTKRWEWVCADCPASGTDAVEGLAALALYRHRQAVHVGACDLGGQETTEGGNHGTTK